MLTPQRSQYRPGSLTPPKTVKPESATGWYEKYPKLPTEEFTYEASGVKSGDPPPYREVYVEHSYQMLDIVGDYGADQEWKILGYSTDTLMRPRYDCIAIMFENQTTFEKTWWHFPA